MSKTHTIEALDRLASKMVQALVDKIEAGTATAADLAVAATLLRENRVQAVPEPAKESAEVDDEDCGDMFADAPDIDGSAYRAETEARTEDQKLRDAMRSTQKMN